MKDLTLDTNLRIGKKGNKVKLIQEWLCLHGFHVKIDKDFGRATDRAVRDFQKKQNLKIDGIVGKNTFARLILPMTNALKPIPPDKLSPGQMVAAYAKQHLKQHPREIGGQNKGPWVRLYMKGNDGQEWLWCAGFVCYILRQACRRLKIAMPIPYSFSCDFLASYGKRKDRFIKGSAGMDIEQITPGSIFLNRRTANDWTHTGIVSKAEEDIFHTIEGNTNDDGNREGYEVCQRIRGYRKKDFIKV